VGNTSVLDVTAPSAGTLIVPFVKAVTKANGFEEY
jgi:hypothetical protein